MSTAAELDEFYIHVVAVETYTGEGAYGPLYASAEDVDCWVDDSRRLVRDAEGNEIVSESTVYTAPEQAALFPPKSKVTWQGKTAAVIVAKRRQSGPLDLPDHIEVALT